MKSHNSQRFSVDYINQLETKSEAQISNYKHRLKELEHSHEAQVDFLRNQIAKYRDQIDMEQTAHLKDLERLKIRLEEKVLARKSEKQSLIESYYEDLTQLKNKLQKENQNYNSANQSFLLMKAEQEAEVENLNSCLETLLQKLNHLKEQSETISKNQIQTLEAQLESLKSNYSLETSQLKKEHQQQKTNIENKLQGKETLIDNLEYEVTQLRKCLTKKQREGDQKLNYLKQSLSESQVHLKSHEEQVNQIVWAREGTLQEAATLSQETKRLETKLEKQRKFNCRLKDKIAKLEKLVYGKGTKLSII